MKTNTFITKSYTDAINYRSPNLIEFQGFSDWIVHNGISINFESKMQYLFKLCNEQAPKSVNDLEAISELPNESNTPTLTWQVYNLIKKNKWSKEEYEYCRPGLNKAYNLIVAALEAAK